MVEKIISKEDLIKYLFKSKAFKIEGRTQIKIDTSLIAPIRLDLKEILSYPNSREIIIDNLVKHIKDNFKQVDAVGGLSPVGIPFTYLVANKMKVPMVYVRNKLFSSKKDGQFTVEGVVKPNEKLVIVGNEIRTGQRLIDTIKILRDKGANVVGCLTVVDYNIEGTAEKFKDIGVKLISLFNLKDVLKVGVEHKYIREKELGIINDWRSDLYNWIKLEKKKIKDLINDTRSNVVEVFLNLELVTLHLDNPLRFNSNILSPIYIDTKKLLSFPAERDYVYKTMLDVVRNNIDLNQIDLIVGEVSSGIAPATWIAEELKKSMVYICEGELDDCDEDSLGNNLNNGDSVLLVDDVLGTAYGSSIVINKLHKFGTMIRNFVCIVDYGIPYAKQLMEDYEHININSVISLTDLLDAFEAQGNLTKEQKQSILEWISDPLEWTRNFKSNKRLSQ